MAMNSGTLDGTCAPIVSHPSMRSVNRQRNQNAGLHYNWHRHYDATLGRYTQPDPLGFVDGPSVYGYAGGSPERFTDPNGLAYCYYSISRRKLKCQPNDPTLPPIELEPNSVVSGNGACANDPGCINNKNLGPVYPGTYSLIPSNKFPGGSWLLSNFINRLLCKLNEPNNRCGMFLHTGTYSLGCITVLVQDENWTRLRNLLDSDQVNTLEVFE